MKFFRALVITGQRYGSSDLLTVEINLIFILRAVSAEIWTDIKLPYLGMKLGRRQKVSEVAHILFFYQLDFALWTVVSEIQTDFQNVYALHESKSSRSCTNTLYLRIIGIESELVFALYGQRLQDRTIFTLIRLIS